MDKPRTIQRQQGVQQQQTGMERTVSGNKAAAFIDSDAVTPVYRRQRGFAGATAIVRNGAGDVTLTLSEPIDIVNGDQLIQATVTGPALHTISVEVVTATTLRVRTNTITAVPAIAAADLDFYISVGEFGPN